MLTSRLNLALRMYGILHLYRYIPTYLGSHLVPRYKYIIHQVLSRHTACTVRGSGLGADGTYTRLSPKLNRAHIFHLESSPA